MFTERRNPILKSYYLIGSLRNPYVPLLDAAIRQNCPGIEPFSDWFSAGQEADDEFKKYYTGRGLSYRDALKSYAAKHIFEFDKRHLDRCDGAILLMPSGKSCHLEAGYMVGKGKPVYALYPDGEPEGRYDLMMQFLTEIFYSESELLEYLNRKPVLISNHQSSVSSRDQLFYNAGSTEEPFIRRFDCV